MNIFKIKLSLLAFGIAFIANGQVDSFKLADYKLPYLKRKALETSFSLSSKNRGNNYDNKFLQRESSFNANDFNSDIRIVYTDYVNMQKRQSESKFDFYFRSYFDKYKSENGVHDYKNISNQVEPFVHINRADRFYFKPKTFFELSPLIDYRFIKRKIETKEVRLGTITEGEKITSHNTKFQLALKVGKGRITQVQDARLAVYIIKKLREQNRMRVELSNDEIEEFANVLAHLKNARVFDSRINDMEDIASADSFLTAHKYISKKDVKYFTTLGDMWRYGSIQERMSGTRISLVVVPGFYFISVDETENIVTPSVKKETEVKAFSVDGGFEFVYEKPINIHWQHSFKSAAYVGIMNGDRTVLPDEKKRDIEIPKLQMGINHGFGFYPNTRTRIDMGYQFKYLKTFAEEDIGDKIMIDDTAFGLAAYIAAYYYVSPKFRITFSSTLGMFKVKGNSNSGMQFQSDFTNVFYPSVHSLQVAAGKGELNSFVANFYIGLTYSIF